MSLSTPQAPRARERRLPPGPRGHLLLGNMLDIWRDPIRTFQEAALRHGPVVRLRLGLTSLYLVSHPDHVQHVLQTNNRNYLQNRLVMPLARTIMGTNLISSDGDYWARHRRIMQPAFAPDHLAAFAAPVLETTLDWLRGWEAAADTGRTLDVAEELRRLALKIAGLTLLGADLSEQDSAAIESGIAEATEYFVYRTRSPLALPLAIPTPYHRRIKAARATVYGIIDRMIQARKHGGSANDDLLHRLVRARDSETGAALTDEEVRYEAIGVLTAGSETTANGLSWTFYLLSQHPEVEGKLLAELDRVLAGRLPAAADLPGLSYARMVLEEAMRLYPPTWVIGRTSVKEDHFGPWTVPAGSHVALSQYVTHRHPDYWPEPLRFWPERFEPERSAGYHRFAYFPFGWGPRACIGRTFAMLEMQLMLATILQRYRLELAPGHPVQPEPQISLRPRNGLLMTIRPRHRTALTQATASP